ncbi:hypothetical protein AHAS_Ahas07G0082600 [Arachis hypogaea]
MYNKIAKQRCQLPGDAYAALKYLEDQATNDPSLYFNHHMDADGTLCNLFWCDGLSRADYSLFGDVLAFDATYKRNKYMCPLVVFSGVNHHNQTIIFATALICEEEKDTYRWLLQQLKVAMNGKALVSVITDGWKEVQADLASVNGRPNRTPNEMWRVFCCDIEMEFDCSCMGIGSFGIPCEHIVCVLVHEDIEELPRSLVLPRWTKTAKVDSVRNGVQVDASGAGLATNDLGHSMPRDPRKCRTKGGLHGARKF